MYATIFLALSALEFGRSVMNSFVLLVISATFLKGFFKGKDSYGFVASIMAIAFAFLSTLLFLEGTFCYGLFGYVTVPALFRHGKGILNHRISSKHGHR